MNLVAEMVNRFREAGTIKGVHIHFKYVDNDTEKVVVERDNGNRVDIFYYELEQVIEAVRQDNGIYEQGPNALRLYVIRYVYSPLWAMMRLLTLDEING